MANIKVELFTDSVLEQSLKHADGIVVRHYNYALQRPRNDNGEPYGPSSGGLLTVEVALGSSGGVQIKEFYERIKQSCSSTFSLLFNDLYDAHGYLDSYDGGIVFEGYVVSLGETFMREAVEAGEKHIILTLKVLITAMTCLGTAGNLNCVFSN